MPNWIIYFFAVPNEINSLGPEWVDLDKNVNQASGSQVITLRLDGGREAAEEGGGGGTLQGTMLSVQGLVQLIPGFLYSLHFCGIQEPLGIWALRPIAPDEWTCTVGPYSLPS